MLQGHHFLEAGAVFQVHELALGGVLQRVGQRVRAHAAVNVHEVQGLDVRELQVRADEAPQQEQNDGEGLQGVVLQLQGLQLHGESGERPVRHAHDAVVVQLELRQALQAGEETVLQDRQLVLRHVQTFQLPEVSEDAGGQTLQLVSLKVESFQVGQPGEQVLRKCF